MQKATVMVKPERDKLLTHILLLYAAALGFKFTGTKYELDKIGKNRLGGRHILWPYYNTNATISFH